MFFKIIKIIYRIITLLSILFLIYKHPLILRIILISQTTAILLITGIISQSFWFSYILLLVIIGGILILFIYIISLIFNQFIHQKITYWLIFSTILIFLISIYYNNLNYINSIELINYNSSPEIINLIKLYNFPIRLINIIIINYLLFLLIIVVKIINLSYGPFRIKI